MGTLIFTEFQLTLIGLGAVALGVIIILLLMKWEAHHATTKYPKKYKEK